MRYNGGGVGHYQVPIHDVHGLEEQPDILEEHAAATSANDAVDDVDVDVDVDVPEVPPDEVEQQGHAIPLDFDAALEEDGDEDDTGGPDEDEDEDDARDDDEDEGEDDDDEDDEDEDELGAEDGEGGCVDAEDEEGYAPL